MKYAVAAGKQSRQSLPLYGRRDNEPQFLHSFDHVVGHVGLANAAESEGFLFGVGVVGDKGSVENGL